jgi:hypothetical protein
MKNINYSCDGKECSKTTSSHRIENWLSIAALDGRLIIDNGIEGKRIISSNSTEELNFCSENCFCSYFFYPKKTILPQFTIGELNEIRGYLRSTNSTKNIFEKINEYLTILNTK